MKVFKRYVAHTHYAVLVLLPTPLITIGNYCCTFPLDIFLENVNNVGPYEHLARPIIHWQLLTSNFPLFASLSSWPHMVCIISRLHCFISYYLNCNYNYFGCFFHLYLHSHTKINNIINYNYIVNRVKFWGCYNPLPFKGTTSLVFTPFQVSSSVALHYFKCLLFIATTYRLVFVVVYI